VVGVKLVLVVLFVKVGLGRDLALLSASISLIILFLANVFAIRGIPLLFAVSSAISFACLSLSSSAFLSQGALSESGKFLYS